MPSSWLCCFLPLAGVLLLGQPTQGGVSFRSPPGPAAGRSRPSDTLWAKQKDMWLKQALQAQSKVLLHMNKKHNDTFFMAPGETTHIMVQSVVGQVYHVNTVLVKADCPDHYTDDLRATAAKDCKSQPDSPKMQCSFEVTEIYGMGSFSITGEECHDYTPPDNADKSADPTHTNSQEDAGSPYV